MPKLVIVFDIHDEEIVDEMVGAINDEDDKYEALADMCKGEYEFKAHKANDDEVQATPPGEPPQTSGFDSFMDGAAT